MIPVLLLSLLFLIIYFVNIVSGFCFLEDGSVYQGLKHKSCWPRKFLVPVDMVPLNHLVQTIKVIGLVLYDPFLHATKVVMKGEQQQLFLPVYHSTMKTRQQSREGGIKGLWSELNMGCCIYPTTR